MTTLDRLLPLEERVSLVPERVEGYSYHRGGRLIRVHSYTRKVLREIFANLRDPRTATKEVELPNGTRATERGGVITVSPAPGSETGVKPRKYDNSAKAAARAEALDRGLPVADRPERKQDRWSQWGGMIPRMAEATVLPSRAEMRAYAPIRRNTRRLERQAKRQAEPSDREFEKKHPRDPGGEGGGRFIAKGASGTVVAGAQTILGLNPSGNAGGQTTQAVVAYQKKFGLQVDGVLGAQTVSHMMGKEGVKPGALTKVNLQFLRRKAPKRERGIPLGR